tara:strand:- start:1006 stop:1233 length:228 start_codon:yes stop_codon:yes gene_type:complete
MNKLIIATSIITSGLLGYNAKKDGTRVEYALDNVQYIKGWVHEDVNNGVLDSSYAEYYLNSLNQTEDLLIEELTN